MIINFERGKQIFGNAEDIFENELLNFANLSSPKQLESCVAAHMQHNSDAAAISLQSLYGSSRLPNEYYSCRKALFFDKGVHGLDFAR